VKYSAAANAIAQASFSSLNAGKRTINNCIVTTKTLWVLKPCAKFLSTIKVQTVLSQMPEIVPSPANKRASTWNL